MKLAISRDSLNSSYTDKAGRVIYKVQTISQRHSAGAGSVKAETKVSKILPDGIPRRQGGSGNGDRFAHLARIEWRSSTNHGKGLSTGTIYRAGEEIRTDSFFSKEAWMGRHLRTCVFTDEEGDEYTWSSSGPWKGGISLRDENNVKLASFHLENGPGRGILRRKHPVLEISTAGEEMADKIFISFLYIEKIQRERWNQSTIITMSDIANATSSSGIIQGLSPRLNDDTVALFQKFQVLNITATSDSIQGSAPGPAFTNPFQNNAPVPIDGPPRIQRDRFTPAGL
ncbi:hypothetical protein PQX77_006392 [Marasmius sp. AFHP31]|nr:hypothetical protein PQX77_006392 [Marasmius sp. AFHP31]